MGYGYPLIVAPVPHPHPHHTQIKGIRIKEKEEIINKEQLSNKEQHFFSNSLCKISIRNTSDINCKQITCDKIFAHSAIVDNSLLCDAASNLTNNLFSSSAHAFLNKRNCHSGKPTRISDWTKNMQNKMKHLRKSSPNGIHLRKIKICLELFTWILPNCLDMTIIDHSDLKS